MKAEAKEHLDHAKLLEVDPWLWTHYHKLQLAGGQYQVYGHEFQIDILQSNYQRQCAKKSPQMGGFTEMLVIRSLHGMRYGKYPQGVLFGFPTADEVTRFSKSRFKPFLSNNQQVIGKHLKDTDAADLKRIGNAFLFFVGMRLQDIEGAQKSSSKLKSVPVDLTVFDEVDEMDQDAVPIALGRMDHSHVKEEFYLANPTVPDYGIDKLYQKSDQRVWMIECQACGRETSLELTFPNCLHRITFSSVSAHRDSTRRGKVIRKCKNCDKAVDPRTGYWVPQFPARTPDLVGWWISHLNSMYTDPADILNEFEDPLTDLVRFYNRRIGMAYISAADRLTKSAVYQCCGLDSMRSGDSGPCVAGADVGGHELHVLIAHKTSNVGLKIIKAARVTDFNELWDLCQNFGVVSLVMDLKPEIHKVREYCQKATYRAFGCDYSEEQKGIAVWNDGSKIVTVNRTEVFDASHKLVTMPGWLVLPRKDEEIKTFAKQVINAAKVLEDKKAAGNVIGKVYRYRKLGADHYRNSLNYLLLAAQHAPIKQVSAYSQIEEVEFYYG